jgi:hypothetical protein
VTGKEGTDCSGLGEPSNNQLADGEFLQLRSTLSRTKYDHELFPLTSTYLLNADFEKKDVAVWISSLDEVRST